MKNDSNITVNKNTILIGIASNKKNNNELLWSAEDSINELAELAKTAGINVAATCLQNKADPHPKHYMGAGKIEELKTIIKTHQAQVVIADDELSPIQHKTLEKLLQTKIMDRTSLILDIFAARANTKEAQLQVEYAQLEYLIPRLTRMWTHLSRLGGGIGTRGPGEKQLEVDKRQIRKRLSHIKKQLKKVKQHRQTRREKRALIPSMTGAIVGYTNAGKSTLMNQLTNAKVLAENKLFATLDPTTRKLKLMKNEDILLTDTVGFIQKLPHQLVDSFQATLEEVIDAHFILHIVDLSHPNYEKMIDNANALLSDLDTNHIPKIYVFNKIDMLSKEHLSTLDLSKYRPYIQISALRKKGFKTLFQAIDTLLESHRTTIQYQIPYHRMDIVNLIHKNGLIMDKNYDDNIHITVKINKIIGEKIMAYLHQSNQKI